jgi:hypothetical protein
MIVIVITTMRWSEWAAAVGERRTKAVEMRRTATPTRRGTRAVAINSIFCFYLLYHGHD